ncbi:lipoxygenase 2 [Actinidia rufa]|uniref:Lipoxygenase n=1 Tax=Actinidia rufa TaxID=165716 RepID=A0A7J0HC79_9ERIC|nr:lipoxygenase 2 [Actinidia rufa]
MYDRIYDYDMYNDLGDPDRNIERHVLGGKEYPYPRRCRTGRSRTKKDPLSESRSSDIYVPRDEAFSDEKNLSFSLNTAYSMMHAVGTSLETAIEDRKFDFPHFPEIDSLFKEEVNLPELENNSGIWEAIKRQAKKIFFNVRGNLLRFKPPAVYERDKFSWFRDEEFSRQTLAGMNPYSIQLAVKQKKLFMLDYHDLLMPYVSKVREIKGTTLYGSRTLFFLTPVGTLRPLAIELTRPPMDDKPQWNQVFTPCWDATGMWLWRLAKTHVLAHDSGYHQLVSHWLRTHCVTEPYIIASHRQLSAMHPIFRLLHPHFRYTMKINSMARRRLINADGIIENHSHLASTLWSSALLPMTSNGEWWTEIRTVGHGDKKDEPWWPKLKSPEDLIGILTTMIWVASGHHSAVNFGQYAFAGYFPYRPTIARNRMPTEDPSDEELKSFHKKPEGTLLSCFPTQGQATIVMVVLHVLSDHSPDEEYIGVDKKGVWADNPTIKAAFEEFSKKLKKLEETIDARNENKSLKNRNGAGVVPYELLKPFSVVRSDRKRSSK